MKPTEFFRLSSETFRAKPRLTGCALVVSFLSALAEALGIGLVLPLLTLNSGGKLPGIIMALFQTLQLTPSINTTLGLLLGLFAMRGMLRYFEVYFKARIANEVGASFRQRFLRAFIALPFDRAERFHPGKVGAMFTHETHMAARAVLLTLNSVAFLSAAAVYALVAVMIHWKVSSASIGLGALVFLITSRLSKSDQSVSTQSARAFAEVNSAALSVIAGLRYIKATHCEAEFIERFDLQQTRHRTWLTLQARTHAMMGGLQQPFAAAILAVVIFLSVVFFQEDPSTVIVVLGVIYRGISSGMNGLNEMVMAMSCHASASPLNEFFKLHPEPGSAPGEDSLATGKRHAPVQVKVRELRASFQDKRVLEGVNLDIGAGETIGIFGPSGSGKSTLLDLLIRLRQPDSGTIEFTNDRGESWRPRLGYVSQEVVLFPGSFWENLSFGNPALSESVDGIRIRAALEAFGLTGLIGSLPQGLHTVLGSDGIQLSGGQRQRLALVRELLKEPDLLILDEFTSALDPDSEREILTYLSVIERRTTTLLVSHKAEPLKICSRVFRMHDGRLELHADRAGASLAERRVFTSVSKRHFLGGSGSTVTLFRENSTLPLTLAVLDLSQTGVSVSDPQGEFRGAAGEVLQIHLDHGEAVHKLSAKVVRIDDGVIAFHFATPITSLRKIPTAA